MSKNTPYLVDAAGRRFPLEKPINTLGRSQRCDVFVADPRASRRHADVLWDGETCMLHDQQSANGTYLNGCRISAPCRLHDGDEITIASAVFTFHDPEATFRSADFPRLVVDETSGDIWVDRKPIALSPKERILFDLLHRHAGSVCSKQQIAEAVWPEYQAEVYDYQIESLVKQLRERLEPDPHNPVLIVTERGRGYKLVM